MIILVASITQVRDDRRLLTAAGLFTVAVLVHNFDHVRRGVDATPDDVFWLGTAAIAVEVAVVVLICARHRWAPLAAAVIGGSLAVGYLVVHFLPERGWASDSFVSAGYVNPVSWFAATSELLAAAVLAVTGVVAVRHEGLEAAASPRDDELPLGRAVRHPLAVTMIVGNAVVLAASFVQS
jgi:hypothetical protein